jgi:GGDEF domain-containing protein
MGLLQKIDVLFAQDRVRKRKTLADRVYEISQKLLHDLDKEEQRHSGLDKQIHLDDWEKELVEEHSDTSDLLVQGLQQRIEDYLSLFELSKEITDSTSVEQFFENIMYSVLGQFGVEKILVFALDNDENSFRLICSDGVEIDSDMWMHPSESLYEIANEKRKIVNRREISELGLSDNEKNILEKSKMELLIPIESKDEIVGFVFASKMISDEDFSPIDVETMDIFRDFAGDFYRNVQDYEQKNKTITSLTDLVKTSLDSFALIDKFSYSTSIEEVFSILREYFKEVGIDKVSLVICKDDLREEYVLHSSNLFSEGTKEKFQLHRDNSDIINTISASLDFYKLDNFYYNSELNNQITNSELGSVDEFWIIPLININWLVGMIFIHHIPEEWGKLSRERFLQITSVISSVLSNIILWNRRKQLIQSPFQVIEDIIEKEIRLASTQNSQFSLLITRIQNVSRIINLLGTEFFEQYNIELSEIISENTKPGDMVIKIGQGKYAIVLTNTGKKSAEVFINKIKTGALSIKNPYKDTNISIQIYLLIYPEQTTDKRKFLEMIEDT